MNGQASRRSLLAGAVGAIALAGCLESGSSGGESDESEESSCEIESQEPATEDWQAIEIADAHTCETFTLESIDRPVVIHTFADFCPTCQAHQDGVKDEYDEVGEDIMFLDLEIELNREPAHIAEYADERGYEWNFAVASPALTDSLIDEFGPDIANHARSPLIAVCPDGSTGTRDKGVGVEEIQSFVERTCE